MRNLTGRQLLLVVAGVLALATVVVGVYGLVLGPGGTAPAPSHDDAIRRWTPPAKQPRRL